MKKKITKAKPKELKEITVTLTFKEMGVAMVFMLPSIGTNLLIKYRTMPTTTMVIIITNNDMVFVF